MTAGGRFRNDGFGQSERQSGHSLSRRLWQVPTHARTRFAGLAVRVAWCGFDEVLNGA